MRNDVIKERTGTNSATRTGRKKVIIGVKGPRRIQQRKIAYAYMYVCMYVHELGVEL